LKLLLDPHVAIRAIADDPRLSPARRDLLLDPMPIGAQEASDHFRASGFAIVPVAASPIMMLDTLPPRHGDPFDRLLVAAALTEPFRLVTADGRLAQFGPQVTVIWSGGPERIQEGPGPSPVRAPCCSPKGDGVSAGSGPAT
jgi:PIN domain nuclease of toxin-antitoxin system